MKPAAWKTQEFWFDLVFELVGACLYALGFYTFADNGGFVPGGVTGVAMLIRHFTGAPLGVLTLALNVPIILFTMPILGVRFFGRSIRTMLFCTFFLDVVMPCFPAYAGSRLLAAMFTGLCSGAGLGLIYMRGSSTGGVDFIIAAVKKKKPHLSFGQIMGLMDGAVVMAGGLTFSDIDAVLYGLIVVFASTYVMDRIIYGAGSGKMVIAVTDHGMRAAQNISDMVDRGSTLTPATGAYTGLAHEMLYCACSNREVVLVRRAIVKADPRAMIMVCEATEVFGEGFHLPEG
jgi:uncharacterized membrane-anchored protein YitT (DUF2179 family)